MLVTHKEYLPSFGLLPEDQAPVCKYTILSINEAVGDCAAYEGVGPTMNGASDAEKDALMQRIKAGGQKIGKDRARELFSEIDDMGLRYRL